MHVMQMVLVSLFYGGIDQEIVSCAGIGRIKLVPVRARVVAVSGWQI